MKEKLFCKICGKELQHASKLCSICGKQIPDYKTYCSKNC